MSDDDRKREKNRFAHPDPNAGDRDWAPAAALAGILLLLAAPLWKGLEWLVALL